MNFDPKASRPAIDANENVKVLLDKAASADMSHDAMNFAQAALNAAQALQVLKQIKAK